MRSLLIITVCWLSLLEFSKVMVGVRDFQYWPTDWVGFSSFGGWRAGMICFGQNFVRPFAPVFLISPFFPSDFGKVRLHKLSKCTSSHQAWSYLSFIGKRFYNTARSMITSTAEAATFQGEMKWSYLYYQIKLEKATCCLLGAKVLNECNLLKFKSQRAPEISLWHTSRMKYVLLGGF